MNSVRVGHSLQKPDSNRHITPYEGAASLSSHSAVVAVTGVEPRLCVPGAACCHYTTILLTAPTGIEPVPSDRQSGVLTSILWSYVPARAGECINMISQISFHLRFLHFRTKNRLSSRTSGSLCKVNSFYLFIPVCAQRHLVTDFHLIRSC